MRILLLLLAIFGASAAADEKDDELRRLREENEELRAEIDLLKARIVQLTQKPERVTQGLPPPSDAEIQRFRKLYTEIRAGQQNKTSELATCKSDMLVGLQSDLDKWTVADFQSRVAKDKRIAAIAKEFSDKWQGLREQAIEKFVSDAKTPEEFAVRLVALIGIVDGSYMTGDRADQLVSSLVHNRLNHPDYRSHFARIEFLRWLQTKGVKSKSVGEAITSEIAREKRRQKIEGR